MPHLLNRPGLLRQNTTSKRGSPECPLATLLRPLATLLRHNTACNRYSLDCTTLAMHALMLRTETSLQ